MVDKYKFVCYNCCKMAKLYEKERSLIFMKKIAKVMLTAVIMLAVALTSVYNLSTVAEAESLYIKKVVSVVFDDSGSMQNPTNGDPNRYPSANYAMQSFCGMLNSEDQLFITYMSKAHTDPANATESIDLSPGKIQGSIDAIANHSAGGQTPFSAVEIAYEKLKSVNDPNPNTQYWLVIITDGDFNSGADMPYTPEVLSSKCNYFASQVMPNGTNPQITFMAIGSSIARPTENIEKGIYVYTAKSDNPANIKNTMSSIADRISGRTRLNTSDIKLVNENTVRVSSEIPLLNIVTFAQGTDAVITEVKTSSGGKIDISRAATLKYGNDVALRGSTTLIGDSQSVIPSGTYDIVFNKSIALENVIVLFEPALETRVTFKLNGREVAPSALADSHDGDKVSVSCKIYELGTDKEISPSLLPSDTEYSIIIYENGAVASQALGQDLTLSDYTLKEIDTKIVASVAIKGFNPISYTARFTPKEHVYVPTYTVSAETEGASSSLKYDDIATNDSFKVIFKFFADGVQITSEDEVRALAPVITTSILGNSGSVEYTSDGRIIFTPNAASAPQNADGSYDVDVSCAISNGAVAAKSYTVLLAEYELVAVPQTGSIVKTQFFGNGTGASFYVTKDGVKLKKSELNGDFTAAISGAHSNLLLKVEVAGDGTVTVTPYSEEERDMNLFGWLFNCWYYWGLSEDAVEITLSHKLGSASSSIAVVGEEQDYINKNVITPLIVEIIILILLAILAAWIYVVVTKPKYHVGTKLYVGSIRYFNVAREHSHILSDFSEVDLSEFNKIKRGNGRLKFKREADVVSAGGIRIKVERGGGITCMMSMEIPWYGVSDIISTNGVIYESPQEIHRYFLSGESDLCINEIGVLDFNEISTEGGRYIRVTYPNEAKYIIVPEEMMDVKGRRVIASGVIFTIVKE